jgi:hypothetical protein
LENLSSSGEGSDLHSFEDEKYWPGEKKNIIDPRGRVTANLQNNFRRRMFIFSSPFFAGVARWYIFKPKYQFWVNFGWSRNGKCWYISWPFGLFCAHLVYLMVIWYI